MVCARLQSGSMAPSSSEPWHPLGMWEAGAMASPSESQGFGSSAGCTHWGFRRKNEVKLTAWQHAKAHMQLTTWNPILWTVPGGTGLM